MMIGDSFLEVVHLLSWEILVELCGILESIVRICHGIRACDILVHASLGDLFALFGVAHGLASWGPLGAK